MKSFHLSALVCAVLALSGCSTPDILREPDDIPALVESYEIPGLRKSTGDVPVILDLSPCVETAAMSSMGFSGKSSIAGRFPVRELVLREFKKVVAGNFRMALSDEHPKLVFEVRSEQVLVTRSWSKVRCRMVFQVRILDPIDAGRKPYFAKRYELTADGMHRNKEEVPLCVYEEIQNLARKFLEDIPQAQNGTLITRLRELGVSVDE